jgi:hypothetical protein
MPVFSPASWYSHGKQAAVRALNSSESSDSNPVSTGGSGGIGGIGGGMAKSGR